MQTSERAAYLRTRCRAYPFWFPASWKTRTRTVFPHIYMIPSYFQDPNNPWWDAVLVHEGTHLDQQSDEAPRWLPVFLRLLLWLDRYGIDPKFRLHEEAAGAAAEIDAAPAERKQDIFDEYTLELATASYDGAASTKDEASQALRLALIQRGCPWTPGGANA